MLGLMGTDQYCIRPSAMVGLQWVEQCNLTMLGFQVSIRLKYIFISFSLSLSRFTCHSMPSFIFIVCFETLSACGTHSRGWWAGRRREQGWGESKGGEREGERKRWGEGEGGRARGEERKGGKGKGGGKVRGD